MQGCTCNVTMSVACLPNKCQGKLKLQQAPGGPSLFANLQIDSLKNSHKLPRQWSIETICSKDLPFVGCT